VKIYQVGGSVRDALLGLPVKDRDFVVVGATPEEMIDRGFKPVGREFPVFLHPDTHEEYALARTERKSGRGHQGFVFFASPEVPLEADLQRRDLTINAMARSEAGELIDPFHGQRDLAARTLRHVSSAFAEDPLRVLRVARFAARFDFTVADETLAMMRTLVESGEMRDLSPERVWRELSLGFVEVKPSRMLSVLRTCGALREIAPELDSLYRRDSGGAQPDLGVATAHALDVGAAIQARLIVQYAVASRHLTVDEAAALAKRLRAPIDCRDSAHNAVRFASMLERGRLLSANDWLTLLSGIDAMRRPGRLSWLSSVVRTYAVAENRSAAEIDAIESSAAGALLALKSIDYRVLGTGPAGDIQGRIHRARLAALEQWLKAGTTR
jgi:tRNA nucleotidyltransferase (CCA-adding enzyme)